MNVQEHWNYTEKNLATIAEQLAPIVEYTDEQTTKSTVTPTHTKRKTNLRKRLLNRLRQHPSEVLNRRDKNPHRGINL